MADRAVPDGVGDAMKTLAMRAHEKGLESLVAALGTFKKESAS